MKLSDKDYILGIWYARAETGDDWFCVIKKGNIENSWEIFYRFRSFLTGEKEPYDFT